MSNAATGGDVFPLVTQVTISPSSASIEKNNLGSFTATVTDQDQVPIQNLPGAAVSSAPGVASTQSVSPTGANGTTTVSVSALAAGSANISVVFDGKSSTFAVATVTETSNNVSIVVPWAINSVAFANQNLDYFVFDSNDTFVVKGSGTTNSLGQLSITVPASLVNSKIQVFVNNLGGNLDPASAVQGQQVITVS